MKKKEQQLQSQFPSGLLKQSQFTEFFTRQQLHMCVM
jgi:hypothetical protein